MLGQMVRHQCKPRLHIDRGLQLKNGVGGGRQCIQCLRPMC